MDKVVQQNAANAEESASASEVMNAQAMKMKSSVLRLVSLIRGTVEEKDAGRSFLYQTDETAGHQGRHALPAPIKEKKELNYEEVIPMEDEFKHL